MNEINVRFDEVVFNFVFKDIPEIIPEGILIQRLETNGFEINKGRRIIQIPSVGEVVVLNLAKRGEVDLLYDPRVSSIGVGTKIGEPKVLLPHIEFLSNLLNELGILNFVKFYQTLARARVWYGRNVKELIKNVVEVKKDVREILGLDLYLQPMTIRLIPMDKDFGEIPWVDILIEPLVTNPSYYYIQFIYNETDFRKSSKVLINLKLKLWELVSALEVK